MRKRKVGSILTLISIIAFLFGLGMVFLYAPTEYLMGEVQRIFYFHVASAWIGFFGFFVTAVSGGLYLLHQKRSWDFVALSSAETGLAFISMTLITGMLWAKPVWGVFWTWEPRLTISAIQWLVYVAYGMLRRSISDQEHTARFAAVYGIIAFTTVPLSWYSIRWWRSLHPLVLRNGDMAISAEMRITLLVSLGAFTLLYGALMYHRVFLEHSRDDLTRLREDGTMLNE